jgi:hypothetical protein
MSEARIGLAIGEELMAFFIWRVFGGERMRGRKFIFVLAGLMACAGCERRAVRDGLPNLVIPVGCASEITLVQCDGRVSPPKCAGARISYRDGCERIVVGVAAKGKTLTAAKAKP